MSPIDAALDDLSAEQERRNKVIAKMADCLRGLGSKAIYMAARIHAYEAVGVSREDWSVLDWRAMKQINEDRAND